MGAAGREGVFACIYHLPTSARQQQPDMCLSQERAHDLWSKVPAPATINTGTLPACWTIMEKPSPRGDTAVAYHQHARE